MGGGIFTSPLPSSYFPLYLSFYVLAYVYYTGSTLFSLFLGSSAFLIMSSFSFLTGPLFIFIFSLYGAVTLFKKRVFRPSILAKALFTFFCLTLFSLALQMEELAWNFQLLFLILLQNLPALLVNFLLGLILAWFLEEKGAILEEAFFKFQNRGGQLNLFSIHELKKTRKASSVKFQARIRKRFGLKEHW